jgi:hypothetical protein
LASHNPFIEDVHSLKTVSPLCWQGRLLAVIFPLPFLPDFLLGSDRGNPTDTVYTPFVGTPFDSPLLYATYGWFNGISFNATFTESGRYVFPA